jgi:hypothetical protein
VRRVARLRSVRGMLVTGMPSISVVSAAVSSARRCALIPRRVGR